jgi:hypothetical protein
VPKFLTRKAAADLLKAEFGWCSASYLGQLSRSGDGPPFKISGRFALYEPTALLAWAESRLRDPLPPKKVAGGAATA